MKILKMDTATAITISNWIYEAPYSIYSFDGSDECTGELMNGPYFYVLDDCEDLVGYVCYGKSACVPAGSISGVYNVIDTIDIGLGLRPDLCGKGIGMTLLQAGIDYGRELFNNDKFRLTVATFNKRAIKVYEKMGFYKEKIFVNKCEEGGIEFQTMIRDRVPGSKVIFWDFDGTLAYRPKMFSSSLKMVLDEYEKGHQITDESLMQWLQSGFPWHEPDIEYLLLREPEAWWDNISRVFERAYVMNGVVPEKACFYAKEARKYLIDPEHYRLYEDTVDTLKYFKEDGYKNIILSNHIPELPEIVECLGLMEYIDICISSANVGFEKPNLKIFQLALEMAGNPEFAWMVGDSLKADIHGAEAAGIEAILVRKPADGKVKYFSPDLKGIIKFIAL